MGGLPEPDWYFEHALLNAEPGPPRRRDVGPVAQWRAWWQAAADGVDPLMSLAARQGFVLSTAQLTELGVTRSRARAAVAAQRWDAPAYGVVAPIDVRARGLCSPHVLARRRHALIAAASLLRRPATVVSGRSAAILAGLPTLSVPELAEVTLPGSTGLGASSVHTFGAALEPDGVTGWFGVPLTHVARTIVDLARRNRRDGLMAADAALREQLVRPAQLAAALVGAAGWPGVRRAREVIALASPLAESPLESLTRLALHDSGLPAPRLQVEIAGYRVDLLLEASGVVIEADGRSKYTDDELWREKRREHVLHSAGFTVERVIWSDVIGGWPTTERRLRTAIRRAGPPSPSPWS